MKLFPFRNYFHSVFSFIRESFFQEIRVNLFILQLDLKSPLSRVNHQSSHVLRLFFILHLISRHPRV